MIRFYLNGKYHEINHLNPNTTVLEYLRLHARQTDVKEGCGSGDCGACTIMAQRLPTQNSKDSRNNTDTPFYTFNSCITLLSLMDGQHLITASYLADNPEHHPERALLHPAQQAMVDCHGSQCGFCTPGFVMSLASLYENKRLQKKSQSQKTLSQNARNNSNTEFSYDEIVASISGNLCRCTGYRPIIDAGLTMEKIGQEREVAAQAKVQDLTTNSLAVNAIDAMGNKTTRAEVDNSTESTVQTTTIKPALSYGTRQLFIPQSIDELNQLVALYPEAILWAGGTDLGLSITQRLLDHETIIQLSAVNELKVWSLSESNNAETDNLTYSSNDNKIAAQAITQELTFGAGMTYQQMLPILEHHFPAFADLFARTASPQIRNMGTLGGNVANASPIGDLPPVLLALEARIHLRHCGFTDENNDEVQVYDEIIPLADFFLDYKKTKLRAGSYVVAVHIPLMQANQHLFIHKISKRYEDDISACLLAARIDLADDGSTITQAKIGLGGMAAIPLLAKNCQQALAGQLLEMASFAMAAQALPKDVTPMTDVRASREYRMHVVQRLLIKCGKQLIAARLAQREPS
ncbi:xanthine dehydrogenase small subunit [uncultured Psychrobacter sp.]|uniref:xanthine dehydrogenase small subunit n=1 Tax=uncultured Psychrobacter sp. TaxID=259303 RepID=UPI0034583596